MTPEENLHPVLVSAVHAARSAYQAAHATHTRDELEAIDGIGADGTPTMAIDILVETAILNAVEPYPVNVLSEEAGHIDNGHALTLVMDPLDGSANAAAGVPVACFSAALVLDDRFEQAATCWLDTGRMWHASDKGAYGPNHKPLTPQRKVALEDAAVDLLRPHTDKPAGRGWWAVASAAKRVRILSCTTLETALVADGAIHAFADPGSDTHRLVDLGFAATLHRLGIGSLHDLHDRPIEFDTDLTRRWSAIFAADTPLAKRVVACIQHGLGDASNSPTSSAIHSRSQTRPHTRSGTPSRDSDHDTGKPDSPQVDRRA
ncbi:inositol monophosphatase family protein [Nocardia sp. NPDC004711]